MLAELLIGASSLVTAGGGAWLGWYMRNAMGRNPDPAAPKPPKDMTLMEVMQQGNKAVARMARDVHDLYHPRDEDGNPCACAYCEIRADDAADEDEPELEAAEANQIRKDHQHRVWVNGQYNDCETHRKGGCVCKRENMTPCGKWVEKNVAESETDRLKTQIKNLEAQLQQLGEAYSKLKMSQREKVVTKTVERQHPMLDKMVQAAKFADQDQTPVELRGEINGHELAIFIAPQREPDEKVVSFGGEVVRPIFHDKQMQITRAAT